MTRPSLDSLIEKWRAKADQFDAEAGKDRVPLGQRHTESLEWEASRLRDCADELEAALSSPRSPQWETDGWQPIATAPKDADTVILRPHRIWGAMDVRYKPTTINGKPFNWLNGDYTTAWPDEAFLPFWRPIPESPLHAPLAGTGETPK